MRPSFAGSAVLAVAMTGALSSAPGVAAAERAFDASGFDAVVLHGPGDVEVAGGAECRSDGDGPGELRCD